MPCGCTQVQRDKTLAAWLPEEPDETWRVGAAIGAGRPTPTRVSSMLSLLTVLSLLCWPGYLWAQGPCSAALSLDDLQTCNGLPLVLDAGRRSFGPSPGASRQSLNLAFSSQPVLFLTPGKSTNQGSSHMFVHNPYVWNPQARRWIAQQRTYGECALPPPQYQRSGRWHYLFNQGLNLSSATSCLRRTATQ